MDPESHKIFSNLLDPTEEMVSTTMLVTGVRFLETFFLGLSTSLSLQLSLDMAYTSSVHVFNMDDSFNFFFGTSESMSQTNNFACGGRF